MLNAPGWIFTLWGGVIADRMNRKKVILICQSIQFFCVAVLLTLLVTGQLQVWMIIVISFFIGTTDSLSMPSYQSIIPSLVKQNEIPRAIALNSTQFNLSRMLGPAIAGLLMAKLGAVACFSANAFSYFPFFVSLIWIYPKHTAEIKSESAALEPSTNLNDFKKLLLNHEVRFPLMTIFVTSLFCSPLMIFCPVLIKDVFHAQVGDFGGALAAFGLGGLIGAGISIAPLPEKFSRNRISSPIAIFLGAIVIAVAANKSLFLLSVLMVIAGAALTASNISASSFLQTNAKNTNRGKIVSLSQLALQGGLSAGGLITGFMASWLGIATALAINGILAIILQVFILLSNRKGDRQRCRPRL